MPGYALPMTNPYGRIEVVGTSKFSVSIRREKQRQDSELKPHAGVFGYQREVVRTYCIKATRPE